MGVDLTLPLTWRECRPPLLGQSPTPRWLEWVLPQRRGCVLTLRLAQLQSPLAGRECRYVQPPWGWLFRPLQYWFPCVRPCPENRMRVYGSELITLSDHFQVLPLIGFWLTPLFPRLQSWPLQQLIWRPFPRPTMVQPPPSWSISQYVCRTPPPPPVLIQ